MLGSQFSLLRRLREIRSVKAGVPLEPLISLHHFQRIGAGHHDLAEQRVGVECDGRHQVIQLAGRQGLVWRRKGWRLILGAKTRDSEDEQYEE